MKEISPQSLQSPLSLCQDKVDIIAVRYTGSLCKQIIDAFHVEIVR